MAESPEHLHLKALAVCWLRNQRRCRAIVTEGGRSWFEQEGDRIHRPDDDRLQAGYGRWDVMGWSAQYVSGEYEGRAGWLVRQYAVEVKVSDSDARSLVGKWGRRVGDRPYESQLYAAIGPNVDIAVLSAPRACADLGVLRQSRNILRQVRAARPAEPRLILAGGYAWEFYLTACALTERWLKAEGFHWSEPGMSRVLCPPRTYVERSWGDNRIAEDTPNK